MKNALVILFNKTEELEALAPIDILRRADVNVISASIEKSRNIVGRSGIEIVADESFDNILKNDFDAVILPGGGGIFDILKSPNGEFEKISEIFRRHFENGKIVAAICAAPLVLHKMGLLVDKNSAAHHSVSNDIPNCTSQVSTVRDANVITSCGAGTAVDFALEIVSALRGEDVAKEITTSICLK